jgi:hypothetical protein
MSNMKKYLPIIASLLVVAGVAFVVINKKNSQTAESKIEEKFTIGSFEKQRSCARHPEFLKQLKVTQPVTIDLSQQQFKGLAFLWGKNFSKVIHPKAWETFEHFSTYSLDEVGNAYLAPMPFISIKPTTFNLQKNIYRLDSKTGKLEIFMNFDDVHPSASNPYGIISLVYDCDDKTLWVSAIDESDYREQKGVIYHIDIKTNKVLQRVDGFDALTITLLKSKKGKFLLAGSARENALYAYVIANGKVVEPAKKLLELPSANEHIRKIKVRGENLLELQTIPFSYTLIAETSANSERNYYSVKWDEVSSAWTLYNK